ncbi:MAG: RNA 2',3'-cyclic phosphodiesterase [Actinomycetota bacterium]
MVVPLRVFVAVPVPDEVRHRIVASLDAVVDTIPGRVVRPGNWHVTLRFLGEIDDLGYDMLVSRLAETDLGRKFRLRWAGLGAFPHPERATVLWMGLDQGEDALSTLAKTVDTAIDRAGFPPEDRPFNPHLTLSRLRPIEDVSALVATTAPFAIPMEVDRVTLYQSLLGSSGAAYQVLEEFPLTTG